MLYKILIGIAAVVAVLVVFIAARPADFSVRRTAVVAAPAAVVFDQVNDFRKWSAWSPWAKLDPNMKVAFEGAPTGAGAVQHWVGNKQVGEGRATITDSKPGELVRMKLQFIKPFEAESTAEFAFKPEGAGTAVTWTMFGKNNFIGKAMGLVMDCEKMVGGQFEQGLAQLKAVAEAQKKS